MSNLLHYHGPAVKKLLGWRINDDEEKWAEKAIESLVKKLKKKDNACGTVEDLEYALANPGAHSKCVTITKSQDGRLQIRFRKNQPHVIYCKVWRWPDLQSHTELKAIPECAFPFEANNRTQQICINPYHYQRIEHPNAFNNYPSSSPEPIPSPLSSTTSVSPPSGMISCASSPEYMDAASSPSAFHEDAENHMRRQVYSQSPSFPTPDFWATITYYELNTRVGEAFKVWRREITIDGFTDPNNCDFRICLGLITNVNRNVTVENTRRHIGRGIKLDYTNDNNLIITNLSESPIFIQSRNCNLRMNQQPATVCRVPPNHQILVFDHAVFFHMLHQASQGGSRVELYDLQKMCFIRLSFVKGWGPDYPRQDVTSTPCWVELQLHLPLSYIDKTLLTLRPPENGANSVT